MLMMIIDKLMMIVMLLMMESSLSSNCFFVITGGKSPTIIDQSVGDLEVAAQRILWGKCMNAGNKHNDDDSDEDDFI
jgi:hypothetical protein